MEQAIQNSGTGVWPPTRHWHNIFCSINFYDQLYIVLLSTCPFVQKIQVMRTVFVLT